MVSNLFLNPDGSSSVSVTICVITIRIAPDAETAKSRRPAREVGDGMLVNLLVCNMMAYTHGMLTSVLNSAPR
jgi:hypothetical protein